MEQQEYKTKIYIKTDDQNNITAIDAEWNIADKTDWICINKGKGDKYYHAQGNYLDNPVMDMQGCHNYKYADRQVLETTAAEKIHMMQ